MVTPNVFLVFSIAFIAILGVIFIFCWANRENYVRGFYRQRIDYRQLYKTVTPLKPLVSPIKDFTLRPTDKIPSIYIFDPKYFSPVRDQGKCGACYIFVICSLLSDNVTIRIGNFGKNLNVQQLLSCYPSKEGGCEGEAPEDVLLWLEQTGFKLSISDEYKDAVTQCVRTDKGISVTPSSVRSLCDYVKRESISDPTPVEQLMISKNIYRMKQQLITDGPFFGSISVFSDLFNFSGNKIYEQNSNIFSGGHAITIVGWCDKGVDKREGFEQGYWVCKNSWGEDWASEYDFKGYFAILMGRNECGIESRAGCADANVKFVTGGISSSLVYDKYIQLLKYIVNEQGSEKTY